MCVEFTGMTPTSDPLRPVPRFVPEQDGDAVPDQPLLAFVAGSDVRTATGTCRIEDLLPGAILPTRAGGAVRLRAVETAVLSRMDLLRDPALAPIRFDAGALLHQSTDKPVLLSPDCPVYTNPDLQTALGASFPAEAFCNGGTVRRVVPDEGVHYVRLHLSASAEICVGGLWVRTEAVTPAPKGMRRPALPVVSDSREFISLTS